MLIDCVYRQGNMCRTVNESINTVSETRSWGCASDNHCGWIMPGATGKDRDRLLIGFYKSFNNWKLDDVLYSSQLAGHDSFDENDYSTIEYEAGMLALFMEKEWKYLLDSDFCHAFEEAKRLGFKLPTNADKAYRKRKKRDKCGKYRRVCNFYFKKKR